MINYLLRITADDPGELTRNTKLAEAFLQKTLLDKKLYPDCKLISEPLRDKAGFLGAELALNSELLIESKAISKNGCTYQSGFSFTTRGGKIAKIFSQVFGAILNMTFTTRKKHLRRAIAEVADDFRNAAYTECVINEATEKLKRRLADGKWENNVLF